jgi:phospholipase/carboxylesterase
MTTLPGSLGSKVRPAAGEPVGVIVLLHGRGADEHDLFGVFDLIDPSRSRLGITLRAPLSLPPGGAHWYELGGIPTPHHDTFMASYRRLLGWFDEFYAANGLSPADTILGGFSQGCVMANALTFAAGTERTAGLFAFSGFLPEVEGLELVPAEKAGMRVAIGHGTNDPVIPVVCSRLARENLEAAGVDVYYREAPMGHSIDPSFAADAGDFVLGDEGLNGGGG